MKYKIGQTLISNDGDILLILDYYVDYHTKKKEYLILTVRTNSFASKQKKYWVYASIIESNYYRLLNKTEKVLYSEQNND